VSEHQYYEFLAIDRPFSKELPRRPAATIGDENGGRCQRRNHEDTKNTKVHQDGASCPFVFFESS